MSRKHNTVHQRATSSYGLKLKRDMYGNFREGVQITADRIMGKSLWYPRKKEVRK